MEIRRISVYEVLEYLVSKGIVVKVYDPSWRIDRKPAYYYLNKTGVTTVRKLLGVKDTVVNPLYKNDRANNDFIEHCLQLMKVYIAVVATVPKDTQIFTKTEINRFKQFPKNRPDLYIRKPDGCEAIIVITLKSPTYIIRKRMDEIIKHSEDEGWGGVYLAIGFIVKDEHTKNSLLYTTKQKLESMGMEEDELKVMVATMQAIQTNKALSWNNVFNPKTYTRLI